MLIAGGSSEPSFSVEIFDPATDSFTFAGSSPLIRTDHAAALLGDGRVLIAGGWSGGAATGAADIYDPATGLLTPTTDLQVARTGHSATALIGGQVLIVGGRDGVTDLSSVEVFDPLTETFAVVGSALAVARSGHRAFRLPNNNNVLVVGGRAAGVPLASAELFTPWTGALSATDAMGAARAGLRGSAVGQDGMLLVAGGASSESLHVSSELYGFATVKTDKDDYAPGQTVVITGGGWQPGETVTLLLQEDVSPAFHDDLVLTATADENGNILNTEFSPQLHDIGVRFYLMATGAGSQAQITFTDSNPAVSHEQCQPGSLYPGGNCIDNGNPDGWKNGQNSGPWRQGDSLPYRALFTDMVTGETYTLRIGYDTTKSLEHALDYLTTFNRTITTANACTDHASAVCVDVDTEPIPADPQVTAGADGILGTADDITQVLGDFTLYGGTIAPMTVSSYTGGNATGIGTVGDPFVYVSDGNREISVIFTADSDGDMVLTWGGHIALNSDWDGVASPQGSPYHMRFNEFTCSDNPNCSTGQHDRALSQGAVIPENADLSITKSDDPDPVVAGTTLTYTVTVTNDALSMNDAINVVVTDTLPAEGTYVSDTDSCVDAAGTLTCSLGNLAIGASTSFTITVTVDASTIGTITNTATVTSDTPDDDLTNNTATEDTLVISNPSILLDKTGTFTDDDDDGVVEPTDGDGAAQPGELISYDFTVTNDGDVTLTNVTLSDTIGGVTITALTDVASNGVDVLAPGDIETATGSYAITQADIDAGSKDNTATATGTPPSGPDVSDDDSHSEPIVRVSTIDLDKTGVLDLTVVEPNGVANPGDIINYDFTVENTGNTTLDTVALSDTIGGVTITALTDVASNGVDVLAPGDIETATGTYAIDQADIDAGVKDNTADVDALDPSDTPVNDDDSHSEPIVRVSTIDLDKTGVLDLTVVEPNGVANPGDIINYDFTVENTGNTTLDTVALSDTIGGVTITALTDVASNGVDVLAPGDIETATGTYAIDQADIDAGVKDNTADVDALDPSDTPVNDDDSHSEPIVRVSTIDLDKTGVLDLTVVEPNGVANPGDIINYDFTVENTGNTTLDTVALSDTIGGVTITALTDVASNGVDVLAPGDIETATGTYAIDQADIDAGVKDNTADVDALDPSDTPVNDDDSHSEPITQTPAIDIVKDPALQQVALNNTANFSITVTNTGNVTLRDVTVSDALAPSCDKAIGDIPDLAPGDSFAPYLCSVSGVVADFVNVARADATTDTAGDVDDDDSAFVDALPEVLVTKTANPGSVVSPGGEVTFSIVVTNLSGDPVTLTQLADTIYGDLTVLDDEGGMAKPQESTDCSLPQALDPAGSGTDTYSCEFVALVSGAPFAEEFNELTASVVDPVVDLPGPGTLGGNPAEDTDTETVQIFPEVVVTDSSLCVFDRIVTGALDEPREFRLLFTPGFPSYKRFLTRMSPAINGSSHECMHGSGQWQVRHAVIEVADVIRCCPEAIGFMNDELGFVVQAFNGTVVDGHAEVVEDVLLVAAQHPGEVSQRWQA